DHRRAWTQAIDPECPSSAARDIMTILDDELSWSEIATLTEGQRVPVLSRGKNVRETLEFLVPPEITGQFRYELMAFLALVVKENQVIDDPVDFFDSLSSLPYLKSLLEVHYRFITQGIDPPSYFQLLNHVPTGASENDRVLSETIRVRIFAQFLYSIMEKTPDWRPIVIKYVKQLNKSKDVVTKLPVSRSCSRANRELARDRFALYSLGLHLRAHVRAPAFGLRRVLYLGNAHRWVHPNLCWSASLGLYNNHPLHMQEMIMSPSALERVRRVLPNIVELTWSARAFNPHLFDNTRMEWVIPHKRILRSLEKRFGFVKLRKGFGHWNKRNPIQLSHNGARLIDNAVARLYLSYLETEEGTEFLGANAERTGEFLKEMRDTDALQISYEFNETGFLRPMVTVVNGEPKRIFSLTRAMLKNTPSSVALLEKENRTSFIISSVPTNTLAYLSRELPVQGMEHGLNIRCMVPESFRNYSGDLFQRLLLPDGSWSEDVTGLVTQVRSALRALSPEITREVLKDELKQSSVLISPRLGTRSGIDAKN
ncbi:MAG: hypothetical protein ACTSUO_00040, partial [Candidatus Thorarchaeota archaeon]